MLVEGGVVALDAAGRVHHADAVSDRLEGGPPRRFRGLRLPLGGARAEQGTDAGEEHDRLDRVREVAVGAAVQARRLAQRDR